MLLPASLGPVRMVQQHKQQHIRIYRARFLTTAVQSKKLVPLRFSPADKNVWVKYLYQFLVNASTSTRTKVQHYLVESVCMHLIPCLCNRTVMSSSLLAPSCKSIIMSRLSFSGPGRQGPHHDTSYIADVGKTSKCLGTFFVVSKVNLMLLWQSPID
ncbi:hypothetical protein BaRGS_00036654 [Batillaria attramentaria]|uniref:Uncharacterized protein n=1 Tax=Batillaria attramentaria TaxID=370345 RepID=A0ABD0JBG3_9CAEN